MFEPNATAFEPTVAVSVAFALPSIDTEPERSPPKEIVLAVAHALAVSALPTTSPVTLPYSLPA